MNFTGIDELGKSQLIVFTEELTQIIGTDAEYGSHLIQGKPLRHMFIDVFLNICHNVIFVILVVILKKVAQLLLKIAEPVYDLLHVCLLVDRAVAVGIVPEKIGHCFHKWNPTSPLTIVRHILQRLLSDSP